MKSWIALAVLGAGLAAGFYHRQEINEWARDQLRLDEDRPIPVTIHPRSYRIVVPAQGELVGLKTVPLSVPRVRGGPLTIAWVVEEGEIVSEGDVLLRFDESESRRNLDQWGTTLSSNAQSLQKTEAETTGQERVLERDQEAAELDVDYAEGQIRKDSTIFSEWEIQESVVSASLAKYRQEWLKEKGSLQASIGESNRRILEIDHKKTSTQIDLARETLANLTLRSPGRGVVLYRNRFKPPTVGDAAWPRNRLMDLAILNQFQGLVQIAEKEVNGIEVGTPVEVELPAFPEESISGTVLSLTRVAKQIHREDPRKYFEARIVLDVSLEQMERMKTGMSLEAEIEVGRRENVLVLPRSAVLRRENQFFVFVKEAEDFKETSIDVVGSDHGFYLISGLEAGVSVALTDPFNDQKLQLPDFNAPATTGKQRFIIFD